jgi:two-component system OmpR family sensor kinase
MKPHRHRRFQERLALMEAAFGKATVRDWTLRHSMRRRVFRTLFALLVVASVGVWVVSRHVPGSFVLDHRIRAAIIGVVALAWVSSLVAHRLSRPLERIANFADELSAGNLTARIKLDRRSGRDLSLVAMALNQMADRLTQQLDDQRALLNAVSHELRSPLQRMKILVELLRQGDLSRCDKLEREIVEMDLLVGDLLANARVDFKALRKERIDATQLALQALEAAELPPEKLNVEAVAPTFEADPTLALRAVINLVENAKRHGGGLTELRITAREGRVCYSAMDDGPGFAPDELDRVFLPFQQTSTSTSVGLGLSLVRRIAESHGGRAWAENRPSGGAVVRFELPALGA